MSERDYAIVKPDEDLEDDSQLPPMPNTQEPVMPWKIESRDPNRIRQFIIHQNIYGKIRFRPRVKLVDFQRRGSGEVELVLNDELGSKAPLETNTVAPSLYAMSQILEKPISLEANLVQSKLNHELLERFLQWGMSKEEIIANFPQIYSNQIVRARIVVAGNAEVRVYIIDPKTKMEQFDQELSDAHANILDTYLTDLYLEDSQKLKQVYEDNPRFNMKMTTAVQTEVGKLANSFNIMGVMNRVPSVATALNEYQDMLERRMLLALERSLQTNKGLVKVGQQLYLKALPSVVNLSYDFRILNYILRQESSSDTKFELNAKNLNTSLRNRNFLASLNPDEKEGGRVAPIPGDEGDHFWGPGNPDGGEGEGNDPANGPKPGENPSDPSWVPISDELYAQFLGERLKLPNLNPKLGRSEKRKKVLRGNRNQKTGHELPEMILENALNKGSAIQVAEGKDPSYDLTEAAAVGFAYMQPNVDWVVKGTKYKPKPDINAVVTFVLDASGSTASHYQAFKKMVFDFKALIKSNYKEVKFNFVVFDSESKEVDEEQFFRIKLGGGTDYATGLNHVLQIQQEKYPIANWDRFSFFFGDLEDGNMERSLALLQELVDESSYVGMVRGSDWGMGTNALRSGAEQMHADSKYFGYVDLDKRKEVTIEDLRKLLKNDQEN